jgi:3-methyladenine DNA glycosylase AlkD
MSSADDPVRRLRDGLTRLADPHRAPQMQAYMKSSMPFRGVPAPPRRVLVRETLAGRTWRSVEEWQQTVTTLWDDARYREERYVALDVAAHRSAQTFQTAERLPLYEHLVVTGAWWDYVDTVAGTLIEPLLSAHRAELTPTMRAWSADPDLWRRRTSIICQLHAGAATDTELLADVVVVNLGDRDFFIRKAIGWALRQYASADASWVREFVAANEATMAPLSRREALKHLH